LQKESIFDLLLCFFRQKQQAKETPYLGRLLAKRQNEKKSPSAATCTLIDVLFLFIMFVLFFGHCAINFINKKR
jgi:hypothetical protein